MEMILKHIRIRNYVRCALHRSEKQAEKLYIKKFNPFYKWRVGNLSGEEIKEAINHFFKYNETTTEINKNIESAKVFALLINTYKREVKNRNPETLINQEWLAIRNYYEKQLEKEREKTYTFEFIENIDNSKFKKDTHGPNLDDVLGSADELREAIKDEIENILDEIHLGDWVVKIKPEFKSEFNYRVAILNLHLPGQSQESIFNVVLVKMNKHFTENYGNNDFQIKKISNTAFIEGYLNNDE